MHDAALGGWHAQTCLRPVRTACSASGVPVAGSGSHGAGDTFNIDHNCDAVSQLFANNEIDVLQAFKVSARLPIRILKFTMDIDRIGIRSL
jgi:hypothetical protein